MSIDKIAIDKKNLKINTLKIFKTKKSALEYLTDNPNKTLKLFSEDVNEKNARNFFVIDHKSLYEIITTSKELLHIYEHYEYGENVKLHIDIDIKKDNFNKKKSEETMENFLYRYIKQAIVLVNDSLRKRGKKNPEIIILTSSTEEKLSAHIIYNNIIFDDIRCLKFFMLDLRDEIINDGIMDMYIYKCGSFRILHCSKFGKTNKLVYDKSVNYKYSTDEQLFYDTFICNINSNETTYHVQYELPNIDELKAKVTQENQENQKPKKDKPKKVKTKKEKSEQEKPLEKLNINFIDKKVIPLERLKKIVEHLHVDRSIKYNEWIRVGIMLFNCNDKTFEIWNEFSMKATCYDYETCLYVWSKFWTGCLGYHGLKRILEIDNPQIFEEITLKEDIEQLFLSFSTLNMNKQWLLDLEDELSQIDNEFKENIQKWIDDDTIKTFALKSCYGSGKTELMSKIIKKYEFKRILYVSYRQTLTNDIHGSFKEHNFESYTDNMYCSDRFICQLDSFDHLINKGCLDYDTYELPQYDLIIMDECESDLHHFGASSFKNSEYIFDALCEIIKVSEKLLVLDGDLSDRSYEFFSSFGNSIIINNQYQNKDKHLIFTNNSEIFENKIDEDLGKGLNIAIVSMSSTYATYYSEKYKNKYSCTLHTSLSGVDVKDKLKDVNEYWSKFRLIVYSSHIESGVNFNVQHVDKIYGILSSNSCSQRAFLQMLSRIRQSKDKNILIYTNKLPYKTTGNYYSFNEVREYISEIKNLTPKLEFIHCQNPKKTIMKVKYEENLYARMMIYWLTEEKNKRSDLFIPLLIRLAENKGYTTEYMYVKDTTSQEKHKERNDSIKKKIIEAKDLADDSEYYRLGEKTKAHETTEEETFKYLKHKYKKYWNVDVVDMDFLDKCYDRFDCIDNYIDLRNPSMLNSPNTSTNLELHETRKYFCIEYLTEIIRMLGFDPKNSNIMLNRNEFEEKFSKIIKESKLYTKPEISLHIFGLKMLPKETTKNFLIKINSILKHYGYHIDIVKKHIGKHTSDYTHTRCNYKLNILPEFSKVHTT